MVSKFRVTSMDVQPLFLLLRTKLVLCVLLFVNSVVCKEQKFAIEPQDQSAVIGSRVTLPCRVINHAGQLQWTKDDFGLGTHRHLVGYDRYRMIGSDEEGDYSLDIREVTLDDDALYQCQVSSGRHGEPAIRSRYARLLVLVPPDPPRILQGSSVKTVEDGNLTLECVSVGGKPAAEITWVDDDGNVLNDVTYTIEPMADGRRFTARSTLNIRPRRQNHNQTLTCQAQNTADRAYQAASILLEVQYAPKVKLHLKNYGSSDFVREGSTFRVVCEANGYPNDIKFKWFLDNETIAGNITNELIFRNVTKDFDRKILRCEARNAVGKGVHSIVLNVRYGPIFVLEPEDMEADEGSEVTLRCVAEGQPEPRITWLRYESYDHILLLGMSQNLTITVNKDTAGVYLCRAFGPYSHIEAYATVFMKGPPRIQSNTTQYGVEGGSVKIDCLIFSVPKPDFIIWSFGGMEINPYKNQNYAFLEETLQDGMTKSSLIIRESEPRHFGLYNCTVSNVYGTDSAQIHLIADRSFPLIVIISGGASSVILMLIIMLLIMLCHRHRRKTVPDFKKPDITDIGKKTDLAKEPDRYSNISDLKLELRQVEGSCEMDNLNSSEMEFRSTVHLPSNMAPGLHIQGGYENELMKQYQRYSCEFTDPSVQFMIHGANGYVPYVDYTKDYIPPVNTMDSISGPMSSLSHHSGSLKSIRQSGPDVIQMSTPGAGLVETDIRYAATYGNPYLRVNKPLSLLSNANTAVPGSTPAPPPYYTVKSSLLQPVSSGAMSPSSTSSRSAVSPHSTSPHSNGAQPQVPKITPSVSGVMYILPSNQVSATEQITSKGTTSQGVAGTHV